MPPNGRLAGSSPDPLGTIKQAIKAVPAVRYALGVVGVAAAGSLVRGYFSSTRLAIYTTVAVFGLMVLLWGFAQLASLPAKGLRYPALVLAWVIFVTFAAIPVILIGSVCFNWPKPFPELRSVFDKSSPVPPVPAKTSGPVKFAGTITDATTGNGLAGVNVRLVSGGPVVATTSSEGFYEFSQTDPPLGRVTIIYQVSGYETLTELVGASEKLDFQMRPPRKPPVN